LEDEMSEDVKTRLVEALKRLDTVMVTTTAQNGTMHGRPMAIADIEQDGTLWFVTGKDSGKTDEIRSDSRAVVTGQEKGLYVSVSGRIELVDDRARIRELWRDSWKVWFPNGKDDPNIVLIRVRPEIGEYWDQQGSKGIQYLFQTAKALLDGKRAEVDDDRQHAKVRL